ncbi:MAG: branched-chain amino acid ABC transporter permease [Alphaproteobacteria bacterium]|nr:branched-chain amino acid ABC transporter permease [Alphaproteobacteria bacterium]
MLLLQTLVDGLILGGVFSLAAVGFSLIFGVMGIVNLTHGIFVVAGAYIAFVMWHHGGIDPLLAIPPIMAVLFAFGYGYQRTVIQWATERASIVASLLVTFGVALMLRNVLQMVFSPDFRSIAPAYSFAGVSLGPIRMDFVRLIGLLTSLVLLLVLGLVLSRSAFGRAIRATAQQPLAASLSGIDVRHVYGLTFGLGAAFAGASGAVIGMMLPFSPAAEGPWTLNAFVVVTLGGVGSPQGALMGGLLLGVISTLTAQYVGPAFTNAMMFLVLVLVLLLRPQGLFGSAFGESR